MSNESATTSATISAHDGVDHSVELGHGNSPAAWTCIAIMLLGSLISCIAFAIGPDATIIFWAGVGVIVVGLIAGAVLKAVGYGVGGSKLKNSGH